MVELVAGGLAWAEVVMSKVGCYHTYFYGVFCL